MQTINFDDGRLNYLGRWFNSGDGRQSGWEASQIRFKVSGTLNLKITCDVVDPDSNSQAFIFINIDKGGPEIVLLTSEAGTFTGEKSHTFTLPNAGDHSIILKVFHWAGPQWDVGTYKNIFKSASIDDEGTLAEWVQDGFTIVGCVGDSWMGVQSDWPMQLPERYNLWPLGLGGFAAADIDARIDYMYDGQLETAEDPVMDVILVNSSVNDYNRSVSNAALEVSLSSIVDKLRAQQPDASIFLIQSPDNAGVGKTYSQYGPTMANIANAGANVYYIPVAGIGDLSWLDDYHLDLDSRQIFANFISNAIINHIGYQVNAGVTKPWITKNRVANSKVATVYDGTTSYSYKKSNSNIVIAKTPGTMVAYCSGN